MVGTVDMLDTERKGKLLGFRAPRKKPGDERPANLSGRLSVRRTLDAI
jgi:hypothetical protein